MGTVSIETLVSKIHAQGVTIVHRVEDVLSMPGNYFSLLWFTCRLVFSLARILSVLKTFETQRCEQCDKFCFSDITPSLEEIVRYGNKLIELQKKNSVPSLLLSIEKHLFGEIQNKVENYWIASDTEIKSLASAIEKKMNKTYAIQ